jgi:hypothetical protein
LKKTPFASPLDPVRTYAPFSLTCTSDMHLPIILFSQAALLQPRPHSFRLQTWPHTLP